MSDSWTAALDRRGAVRDGGGVASFGDPAGELAAAASGSILADLSHLGVLNVTGAEARLFLHSQLSCDVDGLGPDASTPGAYCSPKGRMLANVLLWADGDGFGLALSHPLVPDIEKRLRKFVLRAKVAIADRTAARLLLGVAGPAAAAALAAVNGLPAPGPRHVIRRDAVVTIGLARERFLLVVNVDEVERVWDALARTLRPVGTPCWTWLDIRDGVPLVTAATQDAFVPQMANLELLGGVSFQKGCYPGQEVVARTQYLGKAKRRMFLARIDTPSAPAPGDDLFSEDLGDQASGTIINAAPSPEGGFDALAVVPAASATQSVVHLRALDGPRLHFRALPYSVPRA
jgi:folate-binding protein YgfZ